MAMAEKQWPKIEIIDDNHADAMWLLLLAQEEFESTKKLIDSKMYVFDATWLTTQSGRRINIMGNINEQSFNEIWYGQKYKTFRYHIMHSRQDLSGCRLISTRQTVSATPFRMGNRTTSFASRPNRSRSTSRC